MMKRIFLLFFLTILVIVGGSSMGYGQGLGDSDLISAAREGQLSKVKSLVEQGADVNYTTSRGETALGAAAFAGHVDVVKYLLDKGADVLVGDPRVYYSLAADDTGPNEAIKLIRAILDPSRKSYASLFDAVKQNNVKEVKRLLESGADPNFDLAASPEASVLSPLEIAAKNGYAEIVKILMAYKADVNRESEVVGEHTAILNTPLMLATREGHADVVKLLVSDPSVNLDAAGMHSAIPNCGGWTALMCACKNNQKEIADILIKNGADVDLKNIEGKSALDIAQAAGNQEIVKLIQTMDKENNRMMREKRSSSKKTVFGTFSKPRPSGWGEL
jgi:ankyrin repeat protein